MNLIFCLSNYLRLKYSDYDCNSYYCLLYVTKEVLQVDKENLVVKSSVKDFLYFILPQIPEKNS